MSTFFKFEVRLPSTIEEQRAIAQVLSDLKRAMMQVLLTGRIRLAAAGGEAAAAVSAS